MWRLLILCALLAGGVWLGIHLHNQSGFVLISTSGFSVETPIWLAGIVSFIAFVMLYLVLRIINAVFNIGEYFANLRSQRRLKRAKWFTNKGLIALAEGHWVFAENYLVKGATYSESPLINYLSAARAAQEQGEDKKRDAYLKLAHDSTQGADIAVGLTQAQLQLNHGQYEQSLATLNHLRTLAPRHPYVLKLLKRLYVQLKDWDQLLSTLSLLKKYQVISQEEAGDLERLVYREKLLAANHQSVDRLLSTWDRVPRKFHQDKDIVYIYTNALHDHDRDIEAEKILRVALKKEWADPLIHLYGIVQGEDLHKQLAYAEGWLKPYPDNPALLLALARLCLKDQLWGKAQHYLEASLKLAPSIEAYAELGRLLEQMNKPKLSAEIFRKGLMLAAPQLEGNTNSSLISVDFTGTQNP
ncbi:MAG TPA: heme biosynthesis protein HemY [Gammaproteobacteria bacterium]|nr:heme biosynthesis protein HemY [Gammaproteobacteria bacterium]